MNKLHHDQTGSLLISIVDSIATVDVRGGKARCRALFFSYVAVKKKKISRLTNFNDAIKCDEDIGTFQGAIGKALWLGGNRR